MQKKQIKPASCVYLGPSKFQKFLIRETGWLSNYEIPQEFTWPQNF